MSEDLLVPDFFDDFSLPLHINEKHVEVQFREKMCVIFREMKNLCSDRTTQTQQNDALHQ